MSVDLTFVVLLRVEGQSGLTASLTLTMHRVAPSPLPLDFINSAKFEVRLRQSSVYAFAVLHDYENSQQVLSRVSARRGCDLAGHSRNCAVWRHFNRWYESCDCRDSIFKSRSFSSDITNCSSLSLKLLYYTGISIDEITMVIVIDGDVTAGRKRRNTNVQTMQDLICTQVIVFTAWILINSQLRS